MEFSSSIPEHFYYGTSDKSDKANAENWLVPNYKAKGKSSVRIMVTPNMLAAIDYANKAVETNGGNPIIYLVEPEKTITGALDVIRFSKNNWKTPRARIIKTLSDEEINLIKSAEEKIIEEKTSKKRTKNT